MLPGMISRLVRELQIRSDIDIVCGKSFTMNKEGAFLPLADHDVSEEKVLRLAGTSFSDPFIPRQRLYYGSIGACFLYYAYVWDALNGYDETLHGAEDFDFWLKASRHFKFGRISSAEPPFYGYRIHLTSMSHTVTGAFTTLRLEVLEREASLYPDDMVLVQAMDYYREFAAEARRKRSLIKRLVGKLQTVFGITRK
jgi:hypothetical protein